MRRFGWCVIALAVGSFLLATNAQAKDWVTIKGQVVWDDAVPVQPKITPGVNANVCAMDKDPLEEDYVVNPKNKGLKDVFVWIRPTGAAKDAPFPVADINPALAKLTKDTVTIDQPCCRFIPHVLAAREGQIMVIENSAPIAHNAKWSSSNNGDVNPLLAAGGNFKLPKPLVAESGLISLSCSIHPWMKAYVQVFDHPYYAVTDADGHFEIKLAPTGNYNVFIRHPANGWYKGKAGNKGLPETIAASGLDLGVIKMKKND